MNAKKILIIIGISLLLLGSSFFSGWIICFNNESSKNKARDKEYQLAIEEARRTIADLESSIAREKRIAEDAVRRQSEIEGRYNKLVKLIQGEGKIYNGIEETVKGIGRSISIIEQEIFKQSKVD